MIIYMNICNTKGFLGSRKVWFGYIHEKKKIKIKILAHFCPIFNFELNGKSSRAEPSWKSFSSSSGSSQFGSDSSLIFSTYFWFTNFYFSRIADLANTRFWNGSKNLRAMGILCRFSQIQHKCLSYLDFYVDFHRFCTNIMQI